MSAINKVAETVVAPSFNRPSDDSDSDAFAKIGAISRLETFCTSPLAPSLPNLSISFRESPTLTYPSIMAIVAGTHPFEEMISSTSVAHLQFSGYDMPCEMIVDSRATTGMLFFNAVCTLSETKIRVDKDDDEVEERLEDEHKCEFSDDILRRAAATAGSTAGGDIVV